MIKVSLEIESCRFVLEPSYKNDGSVHSWEILTKSFKKKQANDYDANKQSIFTKYNDTTRLAQSQLIHYTPEIVRVDRNSIEVIEEI